MIEQGTGTQTEYTHAPIFIVKANELRLLNVQACVSMCFTQGVKAMYVSCGIHVFAVICHPCCHDQK